MYTKSNPLSSEFCGHRNMEIHRPNQSANAYAIEMDSAKSKFQEDERWILLKLKRS